jgi:predicted transcriptional regulator
MTSLTVDLDDDAAERLRRQAEQEGVTPAELARRLLTEAAGQDPFDFFDAGSSEVLRGDQVDERLAEHRFGDE